MGCSILCMFIQLPLFKRTLSVLKIIHMPQFTLFHWRGLCIQSISAERLSSLFFSPKPRYLFWKVCISRSLLMEERISDTSLTHCFPFISLPLLSQQHLGRISRPERLPSPLLGWWGRAGGQGRAWQSKNLLENRHTPQLPAPDTFGAAKSPPTLSLYLISFL